MAKGRDPRARWSSDRGAALVLAAVFVVSRLATLALGLRFDAATLGYWQMVETRLLENDLARSVATLHAQPPLFNLAIGAALRVVSPAELDLIAMPLYAALALSTGFAVRRLALLFGASPGVALGAALSWLLSPTLILYELWLFYTLPVMAMLVWAGVLLGRAVRFGERASLLGFFVLLVLCAATRATYHLLWVAVVGLAVARAVPGSLRRRARALALAATLLVAAWSAKNAAVVGSFGTSSWLGMNLARIALEPVPIDERRVLVEKGVLTEAALVGPFAPLDRYPEPLTRIPASAPDVPALVRPFKADGTPNFHHVGYVAVARALGRDARAMIAHDPVRYLDAVGRALTRTLWPGFDYRFAVPNTQHLEPYARGYAYAIGAFGSAQTPAVSLVLVVLLLLLPWAVRVAPSTAPRAAIGFSIGTVLYVLATSSLVELGENTRFFAEVEPLCHALAALWVAVALRDRRQRSKAAVRS